MVASSIDSEHHGTFLSALASAAANIGVSINHDAGWLSRTRYRFTLRLGTEKRYQRISHTGRKVAAVCWHGHRAFFRELFRLAPYVVIRSSARLNGRAVVYTADTFESVHPDTGNGNIGSYFQPLAYRDACSCGED